MSDNKQGQVESIFQELGKKIDDLIIDAKSAKDSVRDEAEEKIKDLKQRKEVLEDEFKEFKDKNDGKWDEIKSHLNGAAQEIKQAAEAAFKKKS